MKIIKTGLTRHVILLGFLAFKIPHFEYGWEIFLRGLLGNIHEYSMWKNDYDERLCPVLFYIPGGFLNIYPKADQLVEGISTKEYHEFMNAGPLPVECKGDSFGRLENRLIAIDYGSPLTAGNLQTLHT